VLAHTDEETGKDFVDLVLDQAGQKGTGRWTGGPEVGDMAAVG
jgi:6-phosphogluconate dehydrogenase